jgi:hypothetical protein
MKWERIIFGVSRGAHSTSCGDRRRAIGRCYATETRDVRLEKRLYNKLDQSSDALGQALCAASDTPSELPSGTRMRYCLPLCSNDFPMIIKA